MTASLALLLALVIQQAARSVASTVVTRSHNDGIDLTLAQKYTLLAHACSHEYVRKKKRAKGSDGRRINENAASNDGQSTNTSSHIKNLPAGPVPTPLP